MTKFIVYINPGECRVVKAWTAYEAWKIVRKAGYFWVKRSWVVKK